jgi:hypothetical protein
MYPVFDTNGWMVGTLCDCGYFEFRKGIPSYEDRLRERFFTPVKSSREQEGGAKEDKRRLNSVRAHKSSLALPSKLKGRAR